MSKRAAWVGTTRARFEEGGEALGKLVGAGRITEVQAKAGRAYADTWATWARLAAAPPRHPTCSDPAPLRPQPSLEAEERMGEMFAACGLRLGRIRAKLAALPACKLVAAVVEMVCLEDVLPVTWERPDMIHKPTLEALRAGLDVLAGEYGIKELTPAAI